MESSQGVFNFDLRETIKSKHYAYLPNPLMNVPDAAGRVFNGETPLQIALEINDIEMVRFLLEHNVNPNERYYWDICQGYSPLHFALITKNSTVAMLLIKHGADIYAMTDHMLPPIYFAIKYNLVQVTKYLMGNGISPDTFINDKMSILNCAIIAGNINVVKCILRHGPNIDLHRQTIVTAVLSTSDNSRKLVKALYKYGFTLHPVDINTQLIVKAIQKGLYDVILNVLQLGVNPSVEIISDDGKDETMLHIAVKAKETKIIQLLLECGADVHLRDASGQTPILIAAKTNNMHIIKLLLKYGANVTDSDWLNLTVLHYAIMEHMGDVYRNSNWNVNNIKTKIVRMFISKGANINARTSHTRSSPLHLAAQIGLPGVVKTLLAFGAPVNQPNAMKVTPLMYARTQIGYMVDSNLETHPCMELKLSTLDVILQHIHRLHRIGLHVCSIDRLDNKIYELANSTSQVIDDEIQFIKETVIGSTYITLHRFLTCTDIEAAGFVRNDDFVDSLKKMLHLPREFPGYATLIRNKLRIALTNNELNSVTFQLIRFFFKENELPLLSNECTEYINSFFSDKDRKILVDQFVK